MIILKDFMKTSHHSVVMIVCELRRKLDCRVLNKDS